MHQHKIRCHQGSELCSSHSWHASISGWCTYLLLGETTHEESYSAVSSIFNSHSSPLCLFDFECQPRSLALCPLCVGNTRYLVYLRPNLGRISLHQCWSLALEELGRHIDIERMHLPRVWDWSTTVKRTIFTALYCSEIIKQIIQIVHDKFKVHDKLYKAKRYMFEL